MADCVSTRRALVSVTVLSFARRLLLCAAIGLLAILPAGAQVPTLAGRLTLIWVDSIDGISSELHLYLSADDGTLTRVRFAPGAELPHERLLRLDGQLVSATVAVPAAGAAAVQDIVPVRDLQPQEPGALGLLASGPLLSGPQPWVTIFCRFPDIVHVQQTPAYYASFLTATGYPSSDDYWRELSFETINLTGSAIGTAWVALPQPRSYYVYDQDGDARAELNFTRVTTDCTAAWDASVDFANFAGINMVFNATLDSINAARGGRTPTLTLDGQTRGWRGTWMPNWATHPGVFGHEMGHGFGLPHSTGSGTQASSSNWDVMSGVAGPFLPQYNGTAGAHTISYHKDLNGWIPAARIAEVIPGTSVTVTLDRLAKPTTSTNYLMVKIPVGDSYLHFYTVEARRRVGYDLAVPGNGVIIHEVITTRSEPAHVVDADNNGNPNDAGAIWIPGETFVDNANGIRIAVVADTTTTSTVVVTQTGASDLVPFSTLAGSAGNHGSSDGMGSDARFYLPRGIAVDRNGNMFVADFGNNVIRKVTPAGVVTTFAGQAGACGSTDGTTTARLCQPGALAIDAGGTLFVADFGLIRKITADGVVTTLAGKSGATGSVDGTGAAARFFFPSAIAVDGAGNVYVADTANHSVRMVTPGGVVTTLAGSSGNKGSSNGTGSEARFSSPMAIAVNAAGLIYIGDENRMIRTISPAGVVTTVAGKAGEVGNMDGIGGAARITSPRGFFLDTNGTLHFFDQNALRRMTTDGVVTTRAGDVYLWGSADGEPATVRFQYPEGLAITATGRVYVADTGNHTIRATTATGRFSLSAYELHFGATMSNGTLVKQSPAQEIAVRFAGPSGAWTVTTDQPWVQISGGSGNGSGSFTVAIVNPGNVLAGASVVTAPIRVSAPSSSLTMTLSVSLVVQQVSTLTAPPFGQIDTPLQNAAGVVGAIAVSGWVLDDRGVAGVKIYRSCLPIDAPNGCESIGGHNVVFVGDAAFLAGARPDVEWSFFTSPQASRAGWGYLLLTNMLPHVSSGRGYGGQGALALYAFATDIEGNATLLGRSTTDHTPTTITTANDTIAKPFGAIDTPSQGETVSGIKPNFGWALTPDADTSADGTDVMIPTSGSSMVVFIDGVPTATVAYNHCRGSVGSPVAAGVFCDDDIASIFGNPTPQPTSTKRTANATKFRNLDDGRAAIGVHIIDTTTLSNGPHTIAWSVTDSLGRNEGIGSRFFTVLNTGTSLDRLRSPDSSVRRDERADARQLSVSADTIVGRTGFDLATAFTPVPADADGVRHVGIPELGRLELSLRSSVTTCYLVANGSLRDPPAGSHLDPDTGTFTWAPGPGYIGTYRLLLVRDGEQVLVDVTIRPAGTIDPTRGEVRMFIDSPTPNQAISGTVTIAGWALDPQAFAGPGIDAVHVWAVPQTSVGSQDPAFLGAATLALARPDVASAFGATFDAAGYSLTTMLAPGEYDLIVYAHSARTGHWEDARTVRVTIGGR